MKVKPELAVVCDDCGCKDGFIYFGGPSGVRRECVCGNEQTRIDVIVDLHQSNDPPSYRVCPKCGDFMCPSLRGMGCKLDGFSLDDSILKCNRCGCLLMWQYNPDGVKLCGDCNRRDEEYRDDMLRDAICEPQICIRRIIS